MISSNGKITAGSINIAITKNGELSENNQEVQCSINKCPDKTATVLFHKSVEYIRDIERHLPYNRHDRKNISNPQLFSREKTAFNTTIKSFHKFIAPTHHMAPSHTHTLQKYNKTFEKSS